MESTDVDVVDTSDVEEREVLVLSKDINHRTSSSSTPANGISTLLMYPQRAIIERGLQRCLDPQSPSRHDRFNDSEVEVPSPRKRAKIAHDAGPVLHSSAFPITNEMSLPSSSRKVVPSTEVLDHSQECTLEDEDEDEEKPRASFPPRNISPHSDWNSLFSSPSRPQTKRDSFTTTSQVVPENAVDPSASQLHPQPSSNLLPISVDRYALFPFLPCDPSTPPRIPSQRSRDQSSHGEQRLHLVASSPLTPLSSPTFLARTPSRSPDPPQLVSTRRPQACHLPLYSNLPPLSAQLLPVEIPDDPQPLNRYSLRRREARQLNPYAYDKLLYKQQLKGLPDAIVKFRSPRRRTDSEKAGEDGTQDEFALPLDNPDEDGDYVDIGDESGGRKRRSQDPILDNEMAEDCQAGKDAKGTDEGWLPEILKELSSSDEDDNEIQKLARRIRRERDKGEAAARAKIRKAAVGVRQEKKEIRKVVKRRLKPFPVHESAEFVPTHFAQRVPSSELSPPSFSRAHSPLITSRSPSPIRSPYRPSASPQTSPHSSICSSKPPRSFDYGVYLQQDDHGALFPRNHSPVGQSAACPAPSSPSGPPTTSGVSALPSNTSGIESESDQSSILEMSYKDRKRLRALKRMMPAAMIARQLVATRTAHRTASPSKVSIESSGSEAEEVRLVPGLSKARKGKYKDVEVRGDPDSSDMEYPSETCDQDGQEDVSAGTMEMLSDRHLAVMVRHARRASPRLKHRDEVISLSDSSMNGASSEDMEGTSSEERVHQSLFDHLERGPAREGSLIDWMLSRTRNNQPKSKPKQSIGSRKHRASGVPRLNIVTNGARRYGERYQTLLPFVKVDTNSSVVAQHSSVYQDRTIDLGQSTAEENKKQKKKLKQLSKASWGPVYNVRHDGTRITSKHCEGKSSRGRTALIIESDDNESRQALDPGWRVEVERWNKPVSPALQPVARAKTSAPTVLRSRLHRRAYHRPLNEIPLPFYFQREEQLFASVHHIVTDMNIIPLPSGIKFGPSSYIERGFLHQLISITSGNLEVVPPTFCNVQGFEIGPTTSAAVFGGLLGPLCDRLAGALHNFRVGDSDTLKQWESLTHASGQLLSWLTAHAEDQEFVILEAALREYLDGLLSVLASLEINTLSLIAHWFVVELFARLASGAKYRRGSAENGHLMKSAKQLIQCLLDVDLQPALTTFRTADADADTALLPHRAAELWVCLIHLLPSFTDSTPGHPLWGLLVKLHPESSPTGLEASEDIWRTIFSLCAISQFSVHGLSTSVFRLSAAWELVAAALKKIILTANPEKDRRLPPRALRKRDEYVCCVVSRCFLLWNRWDWRLDDGMPMFKSLQEIFRSRNFANLLSERSIPMGFLENGDLELLHKQDPHDSVFEVFLKMVVQAVYLLNANVELGPKQHSAHVKKLLQIAVPVSPVPFSRSAPPSTHSLSMLVNRFNAMAVAVHLDPTPSNVKFRIIQAKRCVSFRDADDNSRVACVYGMMSFALIARHHKIVGGLEEVLGWLAEMTDVLMDEYKEGELGAVGWKPATTLIQLLIGSVRRVIETPSLNKGHSRVEYPDPALLGGPWVTKVFNPRNDLVMIQQTGVEIRMLVQSFLDARQKALPAVQPPLPPVVHNQESQEEYDKLFLDINDEELLAALGEEAGVSTVADLKSKEDALCKILNKFITPAVYRLICKHFGESEHAKDDATSIRMADEWTDCWVGCANVLVQNNCKDWGLYMKLGQQSWEKIIDDSWRRRVGLRFNLRLLCLDPGAYDKMKDNFISVLLIATLSCKSTIEHEFISVVLSLDGLQHPLLRGVPLDPIPGTRKYEVTLAEYEVARQRLIETVFANVAGRLRVAVDAESQAYVELVVMMLSTMGDIYQSTEHKEEYGRFYRRVYDMLSGHVELVSHVKLLNVLG